MPLDVLPVPAHTLLPAVPPAPPPAAPALPPPAPPAPPPPPPPPWAKALSGKTIAATRAAVVISFLDIGHSPAFRLLSQPRKTREVPENRAPADRLEVTFAGL